MFGRNAAAPEGDTVLGDGAVDFCGRWSSFFPSASADWRGVATDATVGDGSVGT